MVRKRLKSDKENALFIQQFANNQTNINESKVKKKRQKNNGGNWGKKGPTL